VVDPNPSTLGRAGPGVVACVALVFSPLLAADYVWDDDALILANTALGSLQGAWLALSDGLWASTPSAHTPALYYRPWMLWSLHVDKVLGQSALVAHLHSLLWHLICVALVGWVARLAGCGRRTALVAAALFGLHPAAVESVAWVSARNDLMATAGALTAVGWSLQPGPRTRPQLAAICASSILAAGSKESAYLLPLAILPLVPGGVRATLAPFAASVGGIALVLFMRLLAGVGWPVGADLPHLLGSAPAITTWGLESILPLARRVPGMQLAWPEPTHPFALGLGVVVIIVVLWKGQRTGRGWCLFALLSVLPAWPAVAHLGAVGDRYLYGSLAGLAVAAGLAGQRFPPRWAGATAMVTGLVFLRITAATVLVWGDDTSLWRAAVEEHPNPHTFGSLAKVHELNGDLDAAARAYEVAVTGPHPLPHACWNVSMLELKRGQPSAAAEAGERALEQGCAPDPELVCPTAIGHAFAGDFLSAEARASRVGTDPTGLCTLVQLALSARAGEWEALDRAAASAPARDELSVRLIRLLEAGGDPNTAAGVKAWHSGRSVPAGG